MMILPNVGIPVKLKLKTGDVIVAMRNSYDEDGAIFESEDCIDYHEKDIKSWKYV